MRRSTPGSQIAVLRELWRRHPEDLAAARGLAIALERRGEIDAALAVCTQAEAVLAAWAGWRRRLAVVAARDGGPEAEWRRRNERLNRRAMRGRAAALPLAGSA
jgi:hypothetical protein